MYADFKKFQYSGNQAFSIRLIEVTASIYGTTMTLNFPSDKLADIRKVLRDAEIPLESIGITHISIRSDLFRMYNLKSTLNLLADNGFMCKEFAEEIAKTYPNGYGGKINLNLPFNERFGIKDIPDTVEDEDATEAVRTLGM